MRVSGKIEKDDILPLIDYMKLKFDQLHIPASREHPLRFIVNAYSEKP